MNFDDDCGYVIISTGLSPIICFISNTERFIKIAILLSSLTTCLLCKSILCFNDLLTFMSFILYRLYDKTPDLGNNTLCTFNVLSVLNIVSSILLFSPGTYEIILLFGLFLSLLNFNPSCKYSNSKKDWASVNLIIFFIKKYFLFAYVIKNKYLCDKEIIKVYDDEE